MKVKVEPRVNKDNKAFIDEFMKEYYQRLHNKFKVNDMKINNQGNSSLDILNDIVVSIYEQKEAYVTKENAYSQLHAKFRGYLLLRGETIIS